MQIHKWRLLLPEHSSRDPLKGKAIFHLLHKGQEGKCDIRGVRSGTAGTGEWCIRCRLENGASSADWRMVHQVQTSGAKFKLIRSLNYYYWLQLSCHSAAVQTKQVRKHIHKRNNTRNIIHTSTHINKTNTHYNPPHTHTHKHITKQVTTTTVQGTPKWNSHSIIRYPHYKFTPLYMALLSPRTSP
jgi:hypothetical protein